jgi:hypothetical protein
MDHKTLMTAITKYCDSAGISPSTLCVQALGNSRFFDRLQRRAVQLETDAARLKAWMAQHPPKKGRKPKGAA